MKKALFIISVVMSLFTNVAFAQEVRGVETRLATYEGEEYELKYEGSSSTYVFGHSSLYLGFEFKNLNSIPVSVSVEIYIKGEENDKLIDTKEIVLKSNESYICKYPTLKKYSDKYSPLYYVASSSDSDSEKWKKCAAKGNDEANKYYVKYKAYKLL